VAVQGLSVASLVGQLVGYSLYDENLLGSTGRLLPLLLSVLAEVLMVLVLSRK
jgi:hypothetical protein